MTGLTHSAIRWRDGVRHSLTYRFVDRYVSGIIGVTLGATAGLPSSVSGGTDVSQPRTPPNPCCAGTSSYRYPGLIRRSLACKSPHGWTSQPWHPGSTLADKERWTNHYMAVVLDYAGIKRSISVWMSPPVVITCWWSSR